MEKIKIEKGQTLYQCDEPVEYLDIVLTGEIAMTDGTNTEVSLTNGSMIGATYKPGERYTFNYVAKDTTIILRFDYESEDDIVTAVTSTPAVAPAIASASMEAVKNTLHALSEATDAANDLCKELKYNYNEYQFMCVQLGKAPSKYPLLDVLAAPEPSEALSGWQADICKAFCDNKDELEKSFYPLNVNFCVETVMRAASLGHYFIQELLSVLEFINTTKSTSADFTSEFYDVKSRVGGNSSASSGAAPAIKNAIDMILAFSGVDSEVADNFRKDVKAYIDVEDRHSHSDEMRRLRRSLCDGFYKIYEEAFYKSLETDHLPVEVQMFFYFGFVDEVMAGEANTEFLYKTVVGWEKDPHGRILSFYDWLVKIYKGEAMPSKNEFDSDWLDYLREEVRNNRMTQKEADKLKEDGRAKVDYEIHNMFMGANKTTHGHLASFVPMFNAQDVIRPLDKCLLTPSNVRASFQKVLDIDYSLFYRPALKSYPEFKIQHFMYNTEIKPYIILMPNIGIRGLMWQEVEGPRKETPAHMMLSIFHTEDLDATVVRMCAFFRWEMCRRIMGVRYSDISEPSLTSEYTNYLQFYRKNGYLSSDAKESIKMALQKARNDYKVVFVADYEKYILNEAQGMSRLNKEAREILFKYCTFSAKYRSLRGSTPQYSQLCEAFKLSQANRLHNLDLTLRKMKSINPDGIAPEVPSEIEFAKL